MKKVLRKVLIGLLPGIIIGTLCAVNPAIPVGAATGNINSWIDVKRDYSAVGNGTTNDQPAIQAAIDAANADGGGVVWLPKGNYLITSQLTMYSNVTLKGAGSKTAKITRGGTAGTAAIYAANSDSFVISDMTIDSSNANNGIFATSCTSFRFENLNISYAKNCGIAIYGTSSDGYVNNVYFYECGHTNTVSQYNQALVMEGTDYDHPVTDINITNCKAKQCGSDYNNGVNWEGGGFYAHWYSDRIKFSNCQVISGRKHGFKMQGRHIQLSNCQVIDNGSQNMGYGFSIQGPWVEGTNLSVINSTRSGWGFEIYVSPVYPSDVESRYQLSNIEVVNAKCGIGIYGAGVGTRTHILRDVNISNFTIRDMDMQGIFVDGGCQDVSISNGEIYNCGGTQNAGLEIVPASGNYPNRVFVDNVISRNNYMGVKADNSGASSPYGILNIRTQNNTVNDSIAGTWKWHTLVDRPNGSQN